MGPYWRKLEHWACTLGGAIGTPFPAFELRQMLLTITFFLFTNPKLQGRLSDYELEQKTKSPFKLLTARPFCLNNRKMIN